MDMALKKVAEATGLTLEEIKEYVFPLSNKKARRLGRAFLLSDFMNNQSGTEFGFEPGGFRRHDVAGVGNV